MTNAKSNMELLKELIEAVSQASGAASGLIHYSGDAPGFIVIRDCLELMKEGVLSVASSSSMLAPVRKPLIV